MKKPHTALCIEQSASVRCTCITSAVRASIFLRSCLRVSAALAAALASYSDGYGIIGGSEVPASRAGIVALRSGANTVCSAVVLASDILLTAGHCVPDDTRLRVEAPPAAVSLRIETAVVHPNYNRASGRLSADLALIRLDGALPATVQNAALGTVNAEVVTELRLAGYGQVVPGASEPAPTLRQAPASLMRVEDLPSMMLREEVGTFVWVAGRGDVGACTGDSGGAMSYGGAVLAIITVIVPPCGNMSGGVLVGPHREWIDAAAASWNRKVTWAN